MNTKIYNRRHRFGGNREKAIERDNHKCVDCGMTREEHLKIWNRDITVDHIDGNGCNKPASKKNNDMENLKTLCLICHGKKETRNGRAKKKLTKIKATEIRKRYKRGKTRMIDVAEEYGVTRTTIYHIVSGMTWRTNHEN